MEPRLIPARRAVAFAVTRGQRVEVINTHGQQVVDAWAFSAVEPAAEWMSMEHSRLHMGRLSPVVGDVLVTNRRRPVLTLVEDTSGGVHDTLLAACDRYRYELLGAFGHDNCTDNLHAAIDVPFTPSPLNLFEHTRLGADRALEIAPPVSTPGSYVAFEVELDAVLVLSACPQDMAPTNGPGPTDAHFRVVPGRAG